MHRYLLPASIFTLALAVFADRLMPEARADSGGVIVCEEGFRTPAGINREKVIAWMTEQHSAGRVNFLPYGVNGTIGMICAW